MAKIEVAKRDCCEILTGEKAAAEPARRVVAAARSFMIGVD